MSAGQQSQVRPFPLRLPRVCVAVVGRSVPELLQKTEAIARDNPFVEFRLDYLPTPSLAIPKIEAFLRSHQYITAIATCRRAANGGKFRGSAQAQLKVLQKASVAGCHLVDVELQTADSMKAAELEKLRAKAGLILSLHDFRATRKLQELFERMTAHPADIYKLVTTATSLYDNAVMMNFVQSNSYRYSLVGLCMGEQGIISRILAMRAGSVFTFAAATKGEETAPGQIAAQTLRSIYRIDHVDAATRVYGVAGDPVEHSLSPLMMNAAFRRENVNSVYLPLHAKKLDDLIKCVREVPVHGISVTMPYKEAVMEFLDNSEPLAQKIGAVNTVVRAQDGRLFGFNTDVAGLVRPIEQRMHIAGKKVLVLGAGGAARAATFGLKERGAEVYILNRAAERGQKLARQAGAKTIKRQDLKKLSFDVIINATSVGMGTANVSLLSADEMNARLVMDLVYNPVDTKLLRTAKEKNIAIITGVEMFVHQGARQFEIWTGKPAPVTEMQNVVVAELQRAARQPQSNARAKTGKTSSNNRE